MKKLVRYLILILFLAQPLAAEDKIVDESFMVLLDNQKVGFVRRTMERLPSDQIVTRVFFQLKVKRQSVNLEMSDSTITYEDEKGINSFQWISKQSAEPRIKEGIRKGSEFEITTTAVNQAKTRTQKIPSDILSPFREEMLRKKKKLRPGDKFEFVSFDPHQEDLIVATQAEVVSTRMGEFQGQQQEIISLKKTSRLGVLHEEVGADGSILREEMGNGLSYVRATNAEIASTDFSTEIASFFTIKPIGVIKNPRSAVDVTFEINGKDLDIPAIASWQETEKNSNGDITVRNHSVQPEIRVSLPIKEKQEYLKADRFVTSDDPYIRELAGKIAKNEKDANRVMKWLVRWVFTNIKNKDNTVGSADASEVARKLTGDCSEHSVLFAALARAAGIPTRIVTGFLYTESNVGPLFVNHQWNEVYLGQWVAVDTLFGETVADAARIGIAIVGPSDQPAPMISNWGSNTRIKVVKSK